MPAIKIEDKNIQHAIKAAQKNAEHGGMGWKGWAATIVLSIAAMTGATYLAITNTPDKSPKPEVVENYNAPTEAYTENNPNYITSND